MAREKIIRGGGGGVQGGAGPGGAWRGGAGTTQLSVGWTRVSSHVGQRVNRRIADQTNYKKRECLQDFSFFFNYFRRSVEKASESKNMFKRVVKIFF